MKSELNAISRRGAVRAARATVLCHAASYRGVPFCAGAIWKAAGVAFCSLVLYVPAYAIL